jgi:hypothetical protein
MQAFVSRYATHAGLPRHGKTTANCEGGRRTAPNELMRANQRLNAALRPGGAYGANTMHRPVASVVEHRAMMLAVATAAGWKASVGILCKREQRRNQRQRKSREQQNGEQASHGIPDDSSVRPVWLGCGYMFRLVAQIS